MRLDDPVELPFLDRYPLFCTRYQRGMRDMSQLEAVC